MSDDMQSYLRIFIEETEEELEALVKALLELEDDASNSEAINECFRLLHSLKGSSGMMGYMGISELAHQLESRFELFRSGKSQLDRETISYLLECVDFLSAFIADLRENKPANEDCSQLIARLEQQGQQKTSEVDSGVVKQVSGQAVDSDVSSAEEILPEMSDADYLVRITFEQNLQLADMKARLIVARLSNIGEIISSEPPVDSIESFESLPQFVVILKTDCDPQEVEAISNVDGVESVMLEGRATEVEEEEEELDAEPFLIPENTDVEEPQAQTQVMSAPEDFPSDQFDETDSTTGSAKPSSKSQPRHKVAETVRVDIERLDRLMNLTGELVMTKAQFSQIAGQMGPVFRNTGSIQNMQDLTDRLRVSLQKMRELNAEQSGNHHEWDELEQGLTELEEQSALWDEGKRQFGRVAHAVDQLNRVSDSLQQVVLQTRMVPVEPLFSRFNRVIRDLSLERNKQVKFVIKGEKTELDKRMIDELGDPLLHLIRNSLDHGLEETEDRKTLGKPETGTITLEATQSGNNVFISVQDDGAGINIENIKKRVLERELASHTELEAMNDQQVIDFIWHPGFSTAEKITDISGRGVGMDIVKNRIGDLNGTVEVKTTAGQGTCFKIRLPLTLAIIRCLLIRFRNGIFSIPIDKVREIVSVPQNEIYSVHRHKTISVRDEFIPLISMSKAFKWNDLKGHPEMLQSNADKETNSGNINVVILQSTGKTLGLGVDELLGRDDIVLKSLSDNYVSIRGLSGASVMGDGTVCLMLDTNEIMEMSSEIRD